MPRTHSSLHTTRIEKRSSPLTTALVRISAPATGRPHYGNGEYVPWNHVDRIQKEMLKHMFTEHNLVDIEPCLDPLSAKQYHHLYLVTFVSFDAYIEATRAWNMSELEENLFIKRIIMKRIKEDRKLSSHPTEIHKETKKLQRTKPPNAFDDWWVAQDADHWAQHEDRIEYHDSVRSHGVWLYRSFPGERHNASDRTSFSRVMPASIEYSFWNRKQEGDDIIETIDWPATRKNGRFSFFQNQGTYPWSQLALQRASSSSSNEDGGGLMSTVQTPFTSPSDSPVELHLATKKNQDIACSALEWKMVTKYCEAVLVNDIRTIYADGMIVENITAAIREDEVECPPTASLYSSSPEPGLSESKLSSIHTSTPHLIIHAITPTSSTEELPMSPPTIVENIGYRYPHFFIHSPDVNETKDGEQTSTEANSHEEDRIAVAILDDQDHNVHHASDTGNTHISMQINDENFNGRFPVEQMMVTDRPSTQPYGELEVSENREKPGFWVKLVGPPTKHTSDRPEMANFK